MTDATDKAAALLDIALSTYQNEIQPILPKDKRYTGAMVANALGIALRRLSAADPGATLVEGLGRVSLKDLAGAIRAGDISERTEPRLAEKLIDYLRQELRITNPRFLGRREG